MEVILVDNETVCVPKHVAAEILRLREALRMIRKFADVEKCDGWIGHIPLGPFK